MVTKRCSSWSENFIHFASRQRFSYLFCHPERASAVFALASRRTPILPSNSSCSELRSLREKLFRPYGTSPSFPTLPSAYALGYFYSAPMGLTSARFARTCQIQPGPREHSYSLRLQPVPK